MIAGLARCQHVSLDDYLSCRVFVCRFECAPTPLTVSGRDGRNKMTFSACNPCGTKNKKKDKSHSKKKSHSGGNQARQQ